MGEVVSVGVASENIIIILPSTNNWWRGDGVGVALRYMYGVQSILRPTGEPGLGVRKV